MSTGAWAWAERGEVFVKMKGRAPDGCWVWIGYCDRDGYGRMSLGGTQRPAHRIVYERLVGPITDGLTLDHLCRNRACVNPAHLEPATNGENVLRGEGLSAINARKTHCAHGHEFSEANTRINPDGSRECRACRADISRRHRRRKGIPERGTRTHCRRGHLYDDANTYIEPDGSRQCRACRAKAY